MEALLQLLRPLFAPAFTLWGSPASWLELIALVLSLAMVALNMRVNPLGWPLAIVSSLLYFLVFWDSRLYGEASLQIFFAIVALWGWWQWLRGHRAGSSAPLQIAQLDARGVAITAVGWAVTWLACALLLRTITDSDVPWADGFVTAGSVVGTVLLGRKFIENWPIWLIVNAASVALFAYKGLTLTVVLYVIFFGLAIWGWIGWRERLARSEMVSR